MKHALLASMLLLFLGSVAHAADDTDVVDSFADEYHLEHFSVRLDGVAVSENTSVYVSRDEVVYVSSSDLDAWGLKRPLNGAFERDGNSYYGLQTDLKLATSYNTGTHELEIVAFKGAFRGEPSTGLPAITPGRGAFLNYDLTRENGKYDFSLVHPGGIFETRYLSSFENGPDFLRSRTRWYRLDGRSHSILSIGDGSTTPGWLGTNAPFAGIHFGSDYTADPEYVSSGAPAVSGVATSPSLLEVYVDNVLELRLDVPQGPFTVRDLPSSAAHSDIVMVLTDENGKKTLLVARPEYDPNFIGRGKSEFVVDAGIGRENVDRKGSFYRKFVGEGTYRYGLTNTITLETAAESIADENFASGGADFSLARDHTFGFRIGGGNRRRASEVRYDIKRGKFRFHETFSYNSLRSEPIEGDIFGDAIAQISETSQLAIAFSRRWSLNLNFNRTRNNFGSDQASISARAQYRAGPFSLTINPFYDFVRRRTSANVGILLRLTSNQSVQLDSSYTRQRQTTAALEWRKDEGDPNDPISARVKISANRTQDRRFEIRDQLKWATFIFNWQQQSGQSISEPNLFGALAFVGSKIYPIRAIGEGESFGVLHLPGFRNVRVKVNASDAGRTDGHGDLLLRNLSTYRDNTVDVTTADLPIGVNLVEPVHVVPAKSSALSVKFSVSSHGGVSFTAVDEIGHSLPSGSYLHEGDAQYPVGYDGRVYLEGVQPGAHTITGASAHGACTIALEVPQNTDDIPDLGRVVCRAR